MFCEWEFAVGNRPWCWHRVFTKMKLLLDMILCGGDVRISSPEALGFMINSLAA